MPRRLRTSSGGLVYHVLNRGVGRRRLFDDEADYLAMERVIERTFKRIPVRIVSYCLMPNHWHLALWPEQDGQLSEFMRLLTVTHTQRWHAHHHSAGTGPLYQGRFKSFPVEHDEHCLSVCRYIERNAVRANLVQSARDWQWCSLARRRAGRPAWLLPMSRWPVEAPHDWAAWVDRAESAAKEKRGTSLIIAERPSRGYNLRMPRTARSVEAGTIYHVLNHGNGRLRLFRKPADFAAFETVMAQGLEQYSARAARLLLARLGPQFDSRFQTSSKLPFS